MAKLELTFQQYKDSKSNFDIANIFYTYDEVTFEGVKCSSPEDLEEKFQKENAKHTDRLTTNLSKSIKLEQKMEEKRL